MEFLSIISRGYPRRLAELAPRQPCQAGGAADEVKPRIEHLMTLASDAATILRTLAEFEKEPGDENRGHYNLTPQGVVVAVKAKWNVDLTPNRANEAVQILEENGYVKVRRGPGTTPFRFSGVEVTPQGRFEYEREMERIRKREAKTASARPPSGQKIFFGHGHSPVWKEFRDYVSHRLKLDWDEFNREATAGITTKERLEQMLDDASFAFLVMTAEDERADGSKSARANVIHEIGLFQGRLGFRRAIVLLEHGCEEFSNIHGVSQIRFEAGNAVAKFDEIRQTLEREGLLAN